MSFKVIVIGAGISGLSSAWCLAKQYPSADLKIISEDWHPNTTSDHGFGIIILRCIDVIDDVNNVLDYVKSTIRFCQSLSPKQASDMGIKLAPSITISHEASGIDIMGSYFCQETSVDMHPATKQEVESIGIQTDIIQRLFEEEIQPSKVVYYLGHHYIIDTGRYLPWLRKELQLLHHKDGRKRVQFVSQRLSCLNDAGSCDLLVNCSGLGGKELVSDPNVVPIRGQYLSLDAPEQKHLLVMNHTFAVPRFNDLAIGSVYQIGRSGRATNIEDTEDILRRIEVGIPDVRQKNVRKIDVGIRPARIGGPRVELEMLKLSRSKETPVIHNYGHGPRGIAQHYGCASKVCALALQVLQHPAARL